MGDYTEIAFRADVDAEAFTVMTAMRESIEIALPDHPFFSLRRAHLVFSCSSAYFPDGTHFNAGKNDYGDDYFVSFRSNLKDYDGEIAAFLDWVVPHVTGGDEFIGYSLYYHDDWPTLYRVEAGRLIVRYPGQDPEPPEARTVVGETASREIAP